MTTFTPDQSRAINTMRERITQIGRMLFDRKLTDAAGGNISARVGEFVCITPRFAGQKRQWQLEPEEVMVVDMAGNIVDGQGVLSRESRVHLRLMSDFPDGNAIIHCHAQNVLVFCAAQRPIPPVLEASIKFGVIKVAEFAPAHSPKLAINVAAALAGQADRVKKHAAAVLAPWHGIFCVGKDIDAAFDAVERIDVNARCILMGGALVTDGFAKDSAALVEALASAG